jgi:uncharacterized protein YegP (UPF0339 family)
MPAPSVEYFQDVKGQWRWRVRATNGEIVCQGESHDSRRDAERAAEDACQVFWVALNGDN